MSDNVPRFVSSWFERLGPMPLADAAADPPATAIFSADMVVGFCLEGALASPRVGALVPRVVDLIERSYRFGIRDFVLLQDTHDRNALEFAAFPPHCIVGSPESETVDELSALPFSEDFTVVAKNTLSPAYRTNLEIWLTAHPMLRTAIVVGNCSDLCVHQAAMHLRLRAYAERIEGFRVIVPADCADTYHLDEATASAAGAFAHDGDFFHQVFLYHLAMCGVEVVASLS